MGLVQEGQPNERIGNQSIRDVCNGNGNGNGNNKTIILFFNTNNTVHLYTVINL